MKIADNVTLQRKRPEQPGYFGAALADKVTRRVSPAEIYGEVLRAMSSEAETLPPPEPARDDLRAILAARTVAKLEPLKTKGRIIIDFRTSAEGKAALAAVLAIS